MWIASSSRRALGFPAWYQSAAEEEFPDLFRSIHIAIDRSEDEIGHAPVAARDCVAAANDDVGNDALASARSEALHAYSGIIAWLAVRYFPRVASSAGVDAIDASRQKARMP